MIQNNIWNRLFHQKDLESQEEVYLEKQKLIGLGSETLQFIKFSKTLDELLNAHKIAWSRGYRNNNLGPCEWGMFRTRDILSMTVDEVFLGNIWGLSTHNIRFWNNHADEDMSCNGFGMDPNTKIYSLIMQQYRTLLRRNIERIIEEAKCYVHDFEEINGIVLMGR